MKRLGLCGVLVTILLASGAARAQDTHWLGNGDPWQDSALWDNGVPDATKNAVVDNDGMASVSAISAAALNLTVGEAGMGIVDQDSATMSIGSNLVLGDQITGNGQYRLHSGNLHAQGMSVGSAGLGMFIQYGGDVQVDNTLAIGELATGLGSYSIQAGTLTARRIDVGVVGTGSLDLASPTAVVTVADTLTLGVQASLTAATPVTVKLGGDLVIVAGNGGDLSGLGNVDLVLQGGVGTACKVTAAGVDLGAVAAGWVNNQALHSLTLGGDQAGRLLVDASAGPGALYVATLTINAGGSFDGGVLYYLNGGQPKRLFDGDANLDGTVDVIDLGILAKNYGGSGKDWSEGDFNGDGNVDVVDLGILAKNYDSRTAIPGGTVPEPGSAALLAIGALALLRRSTRK